MIPGIGRDDRCGGILPIVKLIRKGLFPIIQIGIPIVLIVMGTMDLGKAVMASDEKEIKQAQSRLIKRCIYAVVVFFIVTLVTLLMNLIGSSDISNEETGAISWRDCWDAAK